MQIILLVCMTLNAFPALPENEKYLPDHWIDPKSFLKYDENDFSARGEKLHVVITNDVRSKTGFDSQHRASTVRLHPGDPAINAVTVHITDTDGPLVLLLGSYNRALWRLDLAPDVRLDKVIVAGYEQPYVSGLPKGARLITFFNSEEFGITSLYFDSELIYPTYQKIRRLTGRSPDTFQAFSNLDEVTVDGKTTQPAPKLTDSFDPTRTVMLANGGKDLSITTCCRTTLITARATRGFTNGKIYFEAWPHMPTTNVSGLGPQTNVGLLSITASDAGSLLPPYSYLSGHGYPLLGKKERAAMVQGTVIGVAANLDNGRVYYRIGDRWIDGPPDNSNGIRLQKGLVYVAAASLTSPGQQNLRGESWVFNFGDTPFTYQPPQGYIAYSKAPNGEELFKSVNDSAWAFRSRKLKEEADRRAKAEALIPILKIPENSEIHAVGVYEGERGENENETTAQSLRHISVHVTRKGVPLVLLLMAHDAVNWDITSDNGVEIAEVIASGYENPVVTGVPPGVRVVTWSHGTSDPRAISYIGDSDSAFQGWQRETFDKRVKEVFGKPSTSFQGGYEASNVVIDGESRRIPKSPSTANTSGPIIRLDPNDSDTGRAPQIFIMCGETKIVCGAGRDTIQCGDQQIICGQ